MKWDKAAEWIAWRMSARRACITEMHVRADELPVSSEAACETALFIGNLIALRWVRSLPPTTSQPRHSFPRDLTTTVVTINLTTVVVNRETR